MHGIFALEHAGTTGWGRTHLGLLYLDDARARVGLLGEDGGVDLGRRLEVVNATLCELFLLLICMEEPLANRANRRESGRRPVDQQTGTDSDGHLVDSP